MMFFGPRWGAPILEGADEFPETPTDTRCLRCRERFVDGDQGVVIPHAGFVDPDFVVRLVYLDGPGVGYLPDYVLVAEHRECHLVGVVGHHVGVCSCTGWDTTARATGREVLRRVQSGALR